MRDLSVGAVKFINNRKIDKNFPNLARAVEDIITENQDLVIENQRMKALIEKHGIDINENA